MTLRIEVDQQHTYRPGGKRISETPAGLQRCGGQCRRHWGMLDRYLKRIGLDATTADVAELHRAHVSTIPDENLDIHLGREVLLDLDTLGTKMVDGRRGGYCFEQNTLFAGVLEELGHTVTRCLGRVRLSDQVNPRPATHMTLVVEDAVVDVGFGSANPLGPVPLGGQATYGPYT